MPPANRSRLINNLSRIQRMTPEQQRKIQESQRRFNELPENQRDELRQQWENLSPEERKKYSD
jgi:hypothetical protein